MRIAHVVTYVSADGAFGGPVRVALGQAEALAERGHEVTVFAGAPDPVASRVRQDGYELRKFPARRLTRAGGFASMTSPQMLRALKSSIDSFDAAHIHLARDLVTIPAAQEFRRARVKYVLQPHGMIDASRNILVRPLDRLATRPLLRDAAAVLALTHREISDIAGIEPAVRAQRISNGVRLTPLPPYNGRDNVVLFLARLHPRKRPLAFVEMAEMLSEKLPDTCFVLAGPDEGEGARVLQAVRNSRMGQRLEWRGPVSPEATDQLMSRARAYVLPAFDEVFPMTILEALRAGTPVVTTDSLGIADDCISHGAAKITDGTPTALAQATLDVLTDERQAEALRAGGARYLKYALDIARVADELEQLYGAEGNAST